MQSLIALIIWKEFPHKISKLMDHAFEIFCLPRGVLRELEWCVHQKPGFERDCWEDVLHFNYVPDDLRPHILQRIDELERYIFHADGMYRKTFTLLLANILYGNMGAFGAPSAVESVQSEQAVGNIPID